MPRQPLLAESLPPRTRGRPPRFVCSHTNGGLDAAWVHVAGELDIASTPRLESKLSDLEPQARLVVVDLREVEFVDSSGVHALVGATSRARSAGRRVVLLRNPATLDRVFTLTESFEDVDIGDLHPAEPPVQVLLQLAQENALDLAVTDTDEGRTLVRTMPADLSFMLDQSHTVRDGRSRPAGRRRLFAARNAVARPADHE
jgi:anti-sigma B factor antagonist